MTKICEHCGLEFEPKTKRSRCCSRRCHLTTRPSRVPKMVAAPCTVCGKPRVIYQRVSAAPADRCRSCAATANSGPLSGRWKGGHKHWVQGRYGKDKDGLSWKVQRRLAWERDAETCQHCHTTKKRKPDVHHILPYRLSQSHALDNLLCLCQSCHLAEEARIQAPWGGQLMQPQPTQKRTQTVQKKTKAYCPCGRPLQPQQPKCSRCKRQENQKLAIELRSGGVQPHNISKQLGVSIRTIHYWLKISLTPANE